MLCLDLTADKTSAEPPIQMFELYSCEHVKQYKLQEFLNNELAVT